jgi:hypothetical protein
MFHTSGIDYPNCQDGTEKGRRRPRIAPRLADLGFHRLTRSLLTFQVCSALLVVGLMPAVGLSAEWRTLLPFLLIDAALLGAWINLWWVPGHPREWIIAESVIAMLLTIMLTQVLTPAQYVAAAFDRPLIDPLLARADSLMGINVALLADWSRAHPRTNFVLAVAYSSFIIQLALIPLLLGIILRERVALWEYVFHFHSCAAITVTMLALFPAACAFQYYGFESTMDQSRFIAHFNGLREGSFTRLRFNDLEGLISMPSFHMAGALMVLWSLRRHVWALAPMAAVNGLLILATVMTGAHYAVDLVATVLMFGVSVWAWRRYGEKLMDSDAMRVQPATLEAGFMTNRAPR